MIVTPGPFAPRVTQHMADDPTSDPYGNEVSAFTSRSVRVLAVDYPQSVENDGISGDIVTADARVFLQPALVVSELDEFTLTDGLRYRVDGAPARYLHPHTGTAVTRVSLRRIT